MNNRGILTGVCAVCKKGDKTGLKEIYEAYISYIYAVIRGVVKNKVEC